MEQLRRIEIEGVSDGPVTPEALQTLRAFRGSGLNVTVHPIPGREPWWWMRRMSRSVQGCFNGELQIEEYHSYFRYQDALGFDFVMKPE